ncbi:MAG: endopeptidase La, partial [Calditrichia bacterium]
EKLRKTPPFSPEYTVTRNYLDWMIQVPWSEESDDRINLEEARSILDEDHFGLEKPKERILEHLAVLQRVKKIKGPILCFVGPPGVGKTSLGRSIARALDREFVRVSLGGVRDEAEIRGHRRTYIGSMPGKIIQSMKKAGTKNPVFLMDEVDKMSMDFRGDPSSALLEVLDPEQNHSFNDHYMDVDYDLSQVFFITTANVQSNIPLPLQDRMEIIELPGYLEHEKIQIAKTHLIPKQLNEHGLSGKDLEIGEQALLRIIREYTREAGVRNLERQIANLCRKTTRRLVEDKKLRKIKIDTDNLEAFLGKPEYFMRAPDFRDEIGIATGLAWTSYGGDILKIEVNTFSGKGNISLTGKLGDVMKESAQTALSYIRSIAGELEIDDKIFAEKDIHVHVPEGAIPKDGPSAGITLATAMISAFTGRQVRGNVAMTGEITLRGKVLAIGGLNEKMLAAQRNNVSTVIVPGENKKEVDDLPQELREGLTIIQVSDYREVLTNVLK